jgi:hypothetical protein
MASTIAGTSIGRSSSPPYDPYGDVIRTTSKRSAAPDHDNDEDEDEMDWEEIEVPEHQIEITVTLPKLQDGKDGKKKYVSSLTGFYL